MKFIHFILDIIFFLIIFICILIYRKHTLEAVDIFDITAVTSVTIAFLIDFAANSLVRVIAERKEYCNKLTENYKGLMEKYHDDQ